jgi:hypothetical protein
MVLVSVLAGCSSSSGSTTHTSATSSHQSATAPSTSAASGSVSPSPSVVAATAAPAVPACRTGDLDVGVRGGDGAMGSRYFYVVLTNRSGHACRTGGYGGVSMVGAGNGTQIGAPADRDSSVKPVAITLQPGDRARARLQVAEAGNYSAAKCDPATAQGFRVYPPNETHSAYVAEPVDGCRSATVHLMTLQPYRPAG